MALNSMKSPQNGTKSKLAPPFNLFYKNLHQGWPIRAIHYLQNKENIQEIQKTEIKYLIYSFQFFESHYNELSSILKKIPSKTNCLTIQNFLSKLVTIGFQDFTNFSFFCTLLLTTFFAFLQYFAL